MGSAREILLLDQDDSSA
ncbi:hypothetical protein CDAR_283481, partial [Caerostris darwini]